MSILLMKEMLIHWYERNITFCHITIMWCPQFCEQKVSDCLILMYLMKHWCSAFKFCFGLFSKSDRCQVDRDKDSPLNSWGRVSWYPVNLVWSWNLFKKSPQWESSSFSLGTKRVLKDKSAGIKWTPNIHTSESILLDGKAGFKSEKGSFFPVWGWKQNTSVSPSLSRGFLLTCHSVVEPQGVAEQKYRIAEQEAQICERYATELPIHPEHVI